MCLGRTMIVIGCVVPYPLKLYPELKNDSKAPVLNWFILLTELNGYFQYR